MNRTDVTTAPPLAAAPAASDPGRLDLGRLDLDSVVRRNPDILATQIGAEVMMLDVAAGTCFGLNPIGTRIWDGIGTATRVRDLCADLLARFRVTPEVCQAEVLTLLRRMQAKGLVLIDAPQD